MRGRPLRNSARSSRREAPTGGAADRRSPPPTTPRGHASPSSGSRIRPRPRSATSPRSWRPGCRSVPRPPSSAAQRPDPDPSSREHVSPAPGRTGRGARRLRDGSDPTRATPGPETCVSISKWYRSSVPGLAIKDLPKRLHVRLKRRAMANRRSLSSEVVAILERALDDRAGPPPLSEIDALRVRGAAPLTDDLLQRARTEGRP